MINLIAILVIILSHLAVPGLVVAYPLNVIVPAATTAAAQGPAWIGTTIDTMTGTTTVGSRDIIFNITPFPCPYGTE